MSSIVIDPRYQSIAIGNWYRLISSVSIDFWSRFLSIDYAWITTFLFLSLGILVPWTWWGQTETHRANKEEIKLTYERDFQTNPLCQIKPEGRPDLEVVLGQALTPSKSGFSHNRYFSKIRYFIQFAVFPSVHKSLESKLNKVNYYEIKCQ